jgi:hypothetical protein
LIGSINDSSDRTVATVNIPDSRIPVVQAIGSKGGDAKPKGARASNRPVARCVKSRPHLFANPTKKEERK